ncbi:hypothetical protein M427DRAFT_130149 [Gonapodya prolifera JEL478]|uniref:Uncharacterized protein n=1 Tax=Gonapodya prolifera (strain JEL478) TaxID=1344416 RepID=A0A139B0I4_GONPJ|nr:hypothetical protein M427DRAFT_130149 [Gonapodya prolifera JEL478]|eukprot:KXS22477.1 hypothetical protein M427DRAFT_130149 [Gonapodya prolifera JEL478]
MSPLRAFACCLSCWLAVVALITLIALAAITPHSYSTTLTVVAGDRVVVDPGRDAVWTLGYDFRADVGADVFVFQDALDPVDDMEKEKDNKIVSADTATLPALNLTVPMFRTVNVTLPPGGAYKFVRFDLYQGSTWRVEWDLKKWNIEPSFAAFPSDSAFSHFTSTGDASESLHRRQAAKGVWTGRASRRGEYYFAWYTTDSRAYALSGSAAVHVSSLTYDTAGAIGVCRVPSSPPTAASTSTAAAPSPTKTRPREVDCAPYVFADAGARTTFLVVAPVPGEQGHEADSYAVDVTKPRNTILLLDVYLPPAAVLFFSLLICCPLCCGCRLYSCCVPDSEDVTVEPSYAPVVESPGAVGQSPASSAPSPRSGDGSHANEPEQPPSYQEAVRGGWADYGAVGRA